MMCYIFATSGTKQNKKKSEMLLSAIGQPYR